ncbi:hypothetical protein PIB30_067770 [Stylosanthes scabra]|uniref:Putative plant transposon protein domain-containing protein n=1 Tax=Stylosanthes scabra TaxID=79078 RepID=A0ABU6XNM1_9FABA|nr:hypothetical protein [Stylosanthes scabra]
MASSSSIGANVLDAHCFRTLFNQHLYEENAQKKKVIPEVRFNLNADQYPEIKERITKRGWRRLASPRQEIAKSMIQEFYANAARSEEEMEGLDEHPYKSYVRGKEIDFSPTNIRKVMRFKEATPGAENNYDNKQSYDQQLDQVLRDLCIPRETWKMGNKSEVTIARAVLIHSIIKGDDIRVENLIADSIILITQGLGRKGKLGFPSTIYKLCKDAKVRMRQFTAKYVPRAANTQNQYLEELRALKTRQDEFFSNQNNQYNMIRQEQDLMAKEIQDLKKYQVNTTMMGANKNEIDQLVSKVGEQQHLYTEAMKQLKEWTRNSSARECYSVWAHQQANPNLVEMLVYKVTKQIYKNLEADRPMFQGFLKFEGQSSQSAPPQSLDHPTTQPKN